MKTVYLQPLDSADTETRPSDQLLPIVEKLQLALLWCWLLFTILLPPNPLQLVGMVLLGFLWIVASLIGLWVIIKRPKHRALGLRLIAAYPLAVALMFVLTQLGLPVTDYQQGSLLLWLGIGLIPMYFGARWIRRATNTKAQPVTTTRTLSLTLLVTVPIAVLSILLLLILVSGNDAGLGRILGRDWYENTLMATIVASISIALFALPYSLVGLIRATGRRVGMAAILSSVLVAGVCQAAIVGLLAIGQVG